MIHIIRPEVFASGDAATAPLGIVSPKNMELLDAVQRVVDNTWNEIGDEIAGPTGRKACRMESAKSSHPEFPLFASMLASMPSLSNGQPPPLCASHTYILWPVVYTRPSCIVVALMHGCPFAIIVQSHGMDSRERGMMIHTWNSPDPLSVSMFNVNYSQTRHTRAACCCVAHTHRVHVYHLIPA